MRLAVPICRGRVSPVLDVARCVRLVELEDGAIASEVEHLVDGDLMAEFGELGLGLMICGGLSRELEDGLWARGIQVIAGVCGSVDDVVAAFLAGRLGEPRFVMPGWCGRHGRTTRMQRGGNRHGN
jgi:predicted Fe-Mo cluster-binding NifX family protein